VRRELKQFILVILAATAFLVLTGWIVFTFIVPDKYLTILPWMLGFFGLITILTHGYQLKLAKKDMARFTRYSMLISVVRLALYSVFTIVWLAVNNENAEVFVVSIIVVYMVYTITEITSLSKILRKSRNS